MGRHATPVTLTPEEQRELDRRVRARCPGYKCIRVPYAARR